MHAKCTLSREAIMKKIQPRLDIARLRLAQRVLADCNIFIPVDTGAMRATGHIDENFNVIWDTDYAERVYHAEENGLTIHQEKNPNAVSKWAAAAIELKYDSWVDLVRGIFA